MEKKSYTSSQHCTYFYSGIDLNNGQRILCGQRAAHIQQNLTQVPPAPRVSEVRFFAKGRESEISPLS